VQGGDAIERSNGWLRLRGCQIEYEVADNGHRSPDTAKQLSPVRSTAPSRLSRWNCNQTLLASLPSPFSARLPARIPWWDSSRCRKKSWSRLKTLEIR
jgi:hypothetical protein